MTEPPYPPGDPAEPLPPYPGSDPTSGSASYPPAGTPQPPTYGPPTSGAGGYAPPPTSGAGGYGPAGYGPLGPPPHDYGRPPGAPAPAGFATNDERTWAILAHLGGILIGFIAPLITLLAKGNESPAVRAHSVEALNFQITWGIATIIASVLAVCSVGILLFLPIITWVVVIVFSIIAGLKANEGQLYRYPMTWRVVK